MILSNRLWARRFGGDRNIIGQRIWVDGTPHTVVGVMPPEFRFPGPRTQLNSYLTGWVTYFRQAECRKHLRGLDKWIRRKLRCVRLKQRKRTKPIADFLQSLGVPEWRAWWLALSGKGWWRMAQSPPAMEAMSILVVQRSRSC